MEELLKMGSRVLLTVHFLVNCQPIWAIPTDCSRLLAKGPQASSGPGAEINVVLKARHATDFDALGFMNDGIFVVESPSFPGVELIAKVPILDDTVDALAHKAKTTGKILGSNAARFLGTTKIDVNGLPRRALSL